MASSCESNNQVWTRVRPASVSTWGMTWGVKRVEQKASMDGLVSAKGLIRHELGRRLQNLKFSPELRFELDPSIEYSVHINELLKEVLPPDKLLEHCRAVAGKIAAKGPVAVAQAKRAIVFGLDADLRSANELERQAFAVLFGTEDQREGMRAFLEKRPPVFKSR